jgi:hypothetical protein
MLRAGGILLLCLLFANLASYTWNRFRPDLTGDPLARFPRVFLWVWERPEDLRFINTSEVGLAILAKTIILGPEGLAVRPRMQPVSYPPGTAVIATVRIEMKPGSAPALKPEVRGEIVKQILRLTVDHSPDAIQVDFDALLSQRSLYRELLSDLRSRLPSTTRLSMTALASWCLGDDWVSTLPVDEAVPMLFRLGVDRDHVTRHIRGGGDFRDRICRCSTGISMDEMPARLLSGRRLYVFNPEPWTEQSVRDALRSLREKH